MKKKLKIEKLYFIYSNVCVMKTSENNISLEKTVATFDQ